MALKQRSTGGQYIKLKEGKFYLSKDDTNTPFDELEGTLTDMYFKDEDYQGQESRKLYLVMEDKDERYILGFRIDSRYASSFFQFVKNIDITKKFSIHAKSNTIGEGDKAKIVGSLLLSQDGTFAKAYFSKEHPNGLPQMKKLRVSGKDVWDKTDMLEFYEKLVVKELKPQLPEKAAVTVKDEVDNDEPWASEPVDVSDEEDDLPF